MPIIISDTQGAIDTTVNEIKIAAVAGAINKNINTGLVAPSQGEINKEFYSDYGWVHTTGEILSASGSGGSLPPLKELVPTTHSVRIKPVIVIIGAEVDNHGSTAIVKMSLFYKIIGGGWIYAGFKEETIAAYTSKTINKTFYLSGITAQTLKYDLTCITGTVTNSYRYGKCTAWYELG